MPVRNTRERDQTHSCWYIPSAPRVNYSLLVMESTGMMKMATGEDGHRRDDGERRVPEQGLDWFLVATEASGGGTPDLLCSSMFLGYMDIYSRKKLVKGAMRGPRGWGARPTPQGAPPTSWPPHGPP